MGVSDFHGGHCSKAVWASLCLWEVVTSFESLAALGVRCPLFPSPVKLSLFDPQVSLLCSAYSLPRPTEEGK